MLVSVHQKRRYQAGYELGMFIVLARSDIGDRRVRPCESVATIVCYGDHLSQRRCHRPVAYDLQNSFFLPFSRRPFSSPDQAHPNAMPEFKKPKMTNWYDPRQLIDTAKRTVISTTVGKYADPRLGTSDPKPGDFFDYSRHFVPNKYEFEEDGARGDRDEIWIDYAADVGDRWNPTYAVAYYLAQPQIILPSVYDPLPRGEILFLGGDAVYPTASAKAYEARLETP